MFRRLVGAALLLAVCSSVNAQTPTDLPVAVYHSGWGYVNAEGMLQGRAVMGDAPVASARVSVRRNGALISEASTDANGQFAIERLKPGIYEIRCDSANACGAVAFLVRESGSSAAPMNIYCSALPSATVDQLVARHWAPDSWKGNPNTVFGRLEDYIDSQQLAQNPQVLISQGVLKGQLAFPSPANPKAHKVLGFQNGVQRFEAVVDSLGQFEAANMTPGHWDFVVVGQGYAALGAELISAEEEIGNISSKFESKTKFVSRSVVQGSGSLMVPVILYGQESMADGGNPGDYALPPGGYAPPGVGGGFYGGGGAGGGFGGGGGLGGLGGAGGLAALAVGVAALADDDDGFNQNAASGLSP